MKLQNNHKKVLSTLQKRLEILPIQDNPEDIAGYNHNVVLDPVKAYVNENPSASGQDRLDFIRQWGNDNLNVDVILNEDDIQEQMSTPYIDPNPSVQKYLEDLSAVINQVSDQATSNSDYAQFKVSVVEIETAVIASTTLTQDQKAKILGAASIARYSADYWWNYTPVDASTETLRGCIGADVAGYNRAPGRLAGIIVGSTFSQIPGAVDLLNWLFG